MRTPRVTHYVCSAHTHTAHGETHKQIDSQTDRKGDKQTDTQTHKQTDGHTLCACITHTTHRQLTVHIIPSLHTSKHQTHSIVHHTPHRYQHAQIHTYGRLYVCTYVHTYVHVYALTDTHCNEPSSFRCPETRSCASCETACWPSIDWSRLLRRLGVASKPTPDFRCPANASPRPRMRAHNTHTHMHTQATDPMRYLHMYAPIYTHLRAHSLLARVIKPSNNSPPTTQKDGEQIESAPCLGGRQGASLTIYSLSARVTLGFRNPRRDVAVVATGGGADLPCTRFNFKLFNVNFVRLMNFFRAGRSTR